MKAVMVMFDSLVRGFLEPYGCDWVKTPNFTRLSKNAVTFDCNYVGSMPCMPARRELHTGRYNFLHRSWGPLEPFDDSVPEILKQNGIYTHLVSDHYHYWEDSGSNYHTRYSSWDASRGQEGDPWQVTKQLLLDNREGRLKEFRSCLIHADAANRAYIDREERMPQAVTFKSGLDFIDQNHGDDSFFLQIETFDPHEPFFTQPSYKEKYPDDYKGEAADWPAYYFVREDEEKVRHIRNSYAALVTMCDHYLGKVLDAFDKYKLWEDTLLIVNTDHGLMLGEHGWWGKTVMPMYEELARTPLFIYDPRSGVRGERRETLTQTIDIPATLLDFFRLERPKDMQGRSLLPVVREEHPIREYALFGYHEGMLNITDGRYVYMVPPDNSQPFYDYTLNAQHLRAQIFDGQRVRITLHAPFCFTKGASIMKVPALYGPVDTGNYGTRLYDLKADPGQTTPLLDDAVETRLLRALITMLNENECPTEHYERFHLPRTPDITNGDVKTIREKRDRARRPLILTDADWSTDAINMYHALRRYMSEKEKERIDDELISQVENKKVTGGDIMNCLMSLPLDTDRKQALKYRVVLNGRTS